MSFPKVPDINPNISITFEDAINLLLVSIAMEEVSLSKLMDAETDKILCVLDNYKHNECNLDDYKNRDSLLHDAIKIDKSVDDSIKNMIKLQMLLQFKLDNIKDILCCTSSSTTTSTSTSTTTTCTKTYTSTSTTTTCTKTTTTKTTSSTTTTTHTTTSTTSTCSTTTKRICSCCLTGYGKGRVFNCSDEFYNHITTLYAFIYFDDMKSRTIRYYVENRDSNLHMNAFGYNVITRCSEHYLDKLVVSGKGHAEKHLKIGPDITDDVDFILTVCVKENDGLEFKMEIKSNENPRLNHDSGFVQIKSAISNLRLVI